MNLIKALVAKENFIFGLFLGSYPFINKSLLCFLRYFFKTDHGIQDFLSGGALKNNIYIYYIK